MEIEYTLTEREYGAALNLSAEAGFSTQIV